MNIPLSCGVTAISVGSTHLAKALRQLPECHPFPTQAVQLPYRQGEPLPPRNNSIAFQDVLRLICVLAPHASTSMPNVQQMPALQSHSWCHLKKDGRLHLRYHHTTTLNKDHDELKTSRALISVLSEQPNNMARIPYVCSPATFPSEIIVTPTATFLAAERQVFLSPRNRTAC